MAETCCQCEAPVRIIRTEAGSLILLDAEPVHGGEYAIDHEGVAVLREGSLYETHIAGERFQNHRKSCKTKGA